MKNATPSPRPNTATYYEIVAAGPNGERVIVGFTPRVSRTGLMKEITARGEELVALMNPGDDDMLRTRFRRAGFIARAPEAYTDGGWTIGFTGRTERDVLNAQRGAA